MLDEIAIGHISNKQEKTGVTVFLFDKPLLGSCFLAGHAPASRDIALLAPDSIVDVVDALAFSGGSAFGLSAADGVMRWLKEQDRGFSTVHGPVPIVPAACIFDLSAVNHQRNYEHAGYQACMNAKKNHAVSGLIGVGTGATVGKLLAEGEAMSGGFGISMHTTVDGITVMACVVVNAVGDIINPEGKIIAGRKHLSGNFLNTAYQLQQGARPVCDVLIHQNTTLAAIFTNAILNKMQLARIAKIASSGLARAISPCFTIYDGDLLFAFSTEQVNADETVVAAIATEMVQQAVYQAVSRS